VERRRKMDFIDKLIYASVASHCDSDGSYSSVSKAVNLKILKEFKAEKSTFISRYFLLTVLCKKLDPWICLIFTNVSEEPATPIFRVSTMKQHCIAENSNLEIHDYENHISLCELIVLG
jgi:hypothetical protein